MFAELKNEVSSECECGMNNAGQENDNLETSQRIYRMKKGRRDMIAARSVVPWHRTTIRRRTLPGVVASRA